MFVTIKYFGMIAEKLEKQQEELDISASDTHDLISLLESTYPMLCNMQYSIAIDQKIVREATFALDTNSEIALLPPFAGG